MQWVLTNTQSYYKRFNTTIKTKERNKRKKQSEQNDESSRNNKHE